MAGFTCPYCGMVMAVNDETYSTQLPAFETSNGKSWYKNVPQYTHSTVGYLSIPGNPVVAC